MPKINFSIEHGNAVKDLSNKLSQLFSMSITSHLIYSCENHQLNRFYSPPLYMEKCVPLPFSSASRRRWGRNFVVKLIGGKIDTYIRCCACSSPDITNASITGTGTTFSTDKYLTQLTGYNFSFLPNFLWKLLLSIHRSSQFHHTKLDKVPPRSSLHDDVNLCRNFFADIKLVECWNMRCWAWKFQLH